MKFCIRNFICEHTQETPGPMDRVQASRKNKIPVFHIFGVADTGQKACLHIHGVLPYLVLRVGGKATPIVLAAMRSKVSRAIEKEIELSTGEKSKAYSPDYVYKMEVIQSRLVRNNDNKRIASTGNRTRAARVAGEHST
uniref:DNA polymerase zeta catalytic subunit N-terminal domain-containing protein n=1 Tax=Caenorhabditis japonica TaxID=281687 RepID=A0A8R1E1V0_CAEJA